jgi:hypothetical protein
MLRHVMPDLAQVGSGNAHLRINSLAFRSLSGAMCRRPYRLFGKGGNEKLPSQRPTAPVLVVSTGAGIAA